MERTNIKINWEFSSSQKQDYETIIKLLVTNEIISDKLDIISMGQFLDFGLYSLLVYKLFHQKNYYEQNKDKLSILHYINYKIVPIKDRISLFIYKSNDKFFNSHLDDISKNCPLDNLINGNKTHNKCGLNHILNYNIIYLNSLNKKYDNFPLSNEYLGCSNHKKEIINYIFDNPDSISVLGGWGFLFDIPNDFIDFFNDLDQSNKDLLLNSFLSI